MAATPRPVVSSAGEVSMSNVYIYLLLIFAAFGAFCFNMGHRRAYSLTLKALLKGQIAFLSQRLASLEEHRGRMSDEEIARAQYSCETIGQLVLSWYRYFRTVREDKELRRLKAQIKQALEAYLASTEAAGKAG
jgi:hypothetical protein